MATRAQIEAAVDELANAAEEAWVRNGDMLERASEQLDVPVEDLIGQVANELEARFGG